MRGSWVRESWGRDVFKRRGAVCAVSERREEVEDSR